MMFLTYSIILVIICIILSIIFISIYRSNYEELTLKLGLGLAVLAIIIITVNASLFFLYYFDDKEYILNKREKLIINLETIDRYDNYEDKEDIIESILNFNKMVTNNKEKANDKWFSCYSKDYWRDDTIKPIEIDFNEIKYNITE